MVSSRPRYSQSTTSQSTTSVSHPTAGTPIYDRMSMVRALPAIPSSLSPPAIRPLPVPPSKSQVSLSAGSTSTVRPLPVPMESPVRDRAGPVLSDDDAGQLESATLSNASESTSDLSHSSLSHLPRLGKKKRPVLKSVDSFGVDFEMIPQHHLQTQLAKPPTPNKPARLNLGLFSSRSRKESTVGEDPTVRKRGSSTGMSSPSPGAVEMRKAASAGAVDKPTPPPKPAKLGLFNMSLGTRGSVMPTSPSIAAAIEYMRHEQDPPRRAVLDEKRDRETIYGGPGRGDRAGHESREQLAASREQLANSQEDITDQEQLAEGSDAHGSNFVPGHKSSFSDASVFSDAPKSSFSDAHSSCSGAQSSCSDAGQPDAGHSNAGPSNHSNIDQSSPFDASQSTHFDTGKSNCSDAGYSDAGKSSFSDAGADTSSGPSSSVNSLLSNNTGTGTSAHTDHDSESSCFDSAFAFNPAARPQPRVAQDPDKRVSTASSQRTLTAWNTGGFVFPNNNAEQGAPLSRLHTTDGNLDVEHEPEPPKPTPRPARLGQLAGSLKRRSASMSILLPPMISPRSPDPSSEASSPRMMPSSPPPLPTRPRPRAHFDGAVTDSEGTTSIFRKRSRRVQGGIKGKIAAWTAAADQTRPKKYQPQRGDEPRRSDSPQGYPYSHSPASAPALQVHTHVNLPAHAQTPLMSIAALAPAARDLALGVGKRVEKFYRARSASGAGHEPRPSLGAMRIPRAALPHGVEPVLSALLKPAIPGASGLLLGRALDDPVVPRDNDGWIDETLGVRRCVGLPVFVSRSVRHLERWGGEEEGLFRISGRPGHVSRLKAEFDAGADYDLVEIPPGDLDPHAVSHLFKAYLRQLPEPILTRALKSQFDMAMTATDSSNASFDVSKLPTSMASFGESSENMRSLDDALLSDIKILVDQLPPVNYTLLHELCHLLRYTTEHVHTTKMPIANLLLLFCPTLGFSAGFLRCLVEGQDVLFEWGRKSVDGDGNVIPPRTIKTSVSTVTGPPAPLPRPVLSPGLSRPVPSPGPSKVAPSPGPSKAVPSPGPSKAAPCPGPSKHAASASTSAAPSSIRSIKSPLTIDPSSPRARAQTTTGSGPPSRASMFFPNLPKRPSISRLFGVGNSNLDLIVQEPRRSSSSGESYLSTDDESVHPKRQTLPPRVSLDIPDGSFAPSLSPTKDVPESESPKSAKRPALTPIADMFKSSLSAGVPTTASSTITATAVPSSSQTLPPRLHLHNSGDADEMGWSRGVLDAASASLGR